MPSYTGRGTAIGAGEESAWGTAVSRSAWWRTMSANGRRDIDRQVREALNEPNTGSSATTFHDASDHVNVDVELQTGFEGSGIWWKHALWGASTGSISGSLYPHTYVLGAAPPAGLTVELIRGTGDAEVFEGCRVNTFEATIEAGQYMRIRTALIGQTSQGLTSAGTPAYTTNDLPLLHSQMGTLTWNSLTLKARRLSIKVDNRLERVMVLGSLVTEAPVLGGVRVVTMEVEVIYDGTGIETGYLAGTRSNLTCTFTGTGSRTFTPTLQSAVIMSRSIPINRHGIIYQTLTFRGLAVSTDYGLSVVIENEQSSAVAA